MPAINIHEAKTHFSRLLARVAGGESVIISKAGQPVAKLVPIDTPATTSQRTGFLKGQFRVPHDFDRMAADEIEQMFGAKP